MLKWLVFPTLHAVASKKVAAPLLTFTAFQYAMRFMDRPAAEVYALTLTAVGVTGGLAAICLSSTITKLQTLSVLQYTGEKLLHATVLLLQMLFIVFAREGLLGTWPIKGVTWAELVVSGVANTLGFMIVVSATWCWINAIDFLNEELWTNWQSIMSQVTRLPSPSTAASPDPKPE